LIVPPGVEKNNLLQAYGEVYYKQKKYSLSEKCFQITDPYQLTLLSFKYFTSILVKNKEKDIKIFKTFFIKAADDNECLKIASKRLGDVYHYVGDLRQSIEYYKRAVSMETNLKKKEKLEAKIKAITLELLQDIPG
jgi:tetratricopeptide (TPR) repeat protein